MFDDVKTLISAATEGRIGDALIAEGNLAIKIGGFYNAILRNEKMAVDDEQLALAEKNLQACCDDLAKQPKGDGADPKSMDPMTILAFVKMGMELLKAFREWRKKRQEG